MYEDFVFVLRLCAVLLVAEDWALMYRIRISVSPAAMYGSVEGIIVDLLELEAGDLLS